MKLKLWNGHGWDLRLEHHVYVCAKSRAALIRMVNGYLGRTYLNNSEVRNYWNEGAWGNAMEGIEPEIGIWETRGVGGKPKRLV